MAVRNVYVRSCSTCPFFELNTMPLLGLLIPTLREKVGEFPGVCNHPGDAPVLHFMIGAIGTPEVEAERDRRWKRPRIKDAKELPDACPLRTQDVVVTLGS